MSGLTFIDGRWGNSRHGVTRQWRTGSDRVHEGRRPQGSATRCACERLPTYGSLAVNLTGVYLNLRSATAPEPCTARYNVWPYEYALDTVWGLPRACAAPRRAYARERASLTCLPTLTLPVYTTDDTLSRRYSLCARAYSMMLLSLRGKKVLDVTFIQAPFLQCIIIPGSLGRYS